MGIVVMVDDIQQMLDELWSEQEAARIADRVAWPGNRGHVVRAVQPDAPDLEVAMVDEDIAIELHREFGVDIDHARNQGWLALDDVMAMLDAKWRDGGDLGVVAAPDRAAAMRLIQRLSLKAAERAGCAIVGNPPDFDPWVPLDIDGQLRVDLEGLDAWLAQAGERNLAAMAADRAVAVQLRAFATSPPR